MALSGDRGKTGDGRRPAERHAPDYSFHRRVVSEETPLLAAATNVPYHHRGDTSPDETLRDDELEEREIDPNEFDQMLSRSTSYTSGLGMEPESQESAMLRGPRRYSRQGRRGSTASGRTRSVGSAAGWREEAVIEEDEEDKTYENPYLGGVSIGRFWLIYGGLLANLVGQRLRYPLLLFC